MASSMFLSGLFLLLKLFDQPSIHQLNFPCHGEVNQFLTNIQYLFSEEFDRIPASVTKKMGGKMEQFVEAAGFKIDQRYSLIRKPIVRGKADHSGQK